MELLWLSTGGAARTHEHSGLPLMAKPGLALFADPPKCLSKIQF